ncbi:HAMP domain-containing sensor histidine kinase [Nocardioides sp. URHA0020]|uniref:HAMP domain-containing sensor histidine kinase n=1 Tax=Nocardioides sp. URHA0020 TaxID=1380392 RepID=UPI00068638CD|nr:HAMP domain-containing sensor histidine kinase [Nocardioides sp. URHA0020]
MRWPRLPRSFRRQIVVLTAGITAVAMLLLALVVQVVLARITTSDVDRVLQDRADAVISSATTSAGGQLLVPDSQLDAGVAVYDDQGVLVAGAPPESLREHYADLATVVTRTVETHAEHGRILAEPFTATGGAAGVVIVTERLEPYEEAERLALIVTLVTGLLTTVAAAAIAAWTTRRALRPVTVMAETAAEWSEHDLSRRFNLGPPDNELSALAGTLDQLLEKVASAIRSEQRLTSELAHELRTPLTTIQGMTDLILLRDILPTETQRDLEEISGASQRMSATITALLDLARNEAQIVRASHCSLVEVLEDVTGQAAPNDLVLDVDVVDARLGLPHALAVRAISPVVENALRFANTRVRISAAGTSGTVEVFVDDDGPGVAQEEAERIFEPGMTSAVGTGAGLGLAIARRIARTVGGEVAVAQDAAATRFVIRLPRG